jgi:ABC-type Na+ transport system ATPase subunit NatA
MVSIVNLQKSYNNKIHALRGVSVDLEKGQIVTLLG